MHRVHHEGEDWGLMIFPNHSRWGVYIFDDWGWDLEKVGEDHPSEESAVAWVQENIKKTLFELPGQGLLDESADS